MKNWLWKLVLVALLPISAAASVPPTYYMAEKIAKHRASLETAIIQFELIRPISADKTLVPMLWRGSIFFNAAKSGTRKDASHFPVLATLLDPDSRKVLSAWRNFGLPVNREEDLVNRRTRAEIKANPDNDGPFYKREEGLSIHRMGERFAWQISDAGLVHKMMIEKDSFLPLAIAAPCPEGPFLSAATSSAPNAKEKDNNSAASKSGATICSIEFHYDSNSSLQIPSSAIVRANDHDLVTMKINRVLLNPNDKLVHDLMKPNQQEEIDNSDPIVGAFYSYFLR